MNEDKFLKVAKEAALEAGKVISKYTGKVRELTVKNDDVSDFATQADIEAEEKIVEILTKNFPKHNIIAEEKARINKDSEYTWVIDPLDGTISFSIDNPFYSVSIGLLKEHKPVLGVIYHVSKGHLYYAQEGQRAYLNGKSIQVSKRSSLDGAVIVMDLGHRARRQEKFDSYVNKLKNRVGYIFSFGGLVTSLGMVAKSMMDAAVSQAWLWDFAAGTVIVREAGGKVTDFEGKEPDWSKERLEIVASNGLIHDQILEALKK